MPSDAVTIVVAIASPTAAGAVAVLIHRQRLAHERELGDLAVVRDVLARAVAAGIEVEHAVVAWDNVYVSHVGSEGPHLADAVDSAVAAWRSRAATLAIVLPAAHPVLNAADEVESAVVQLVYYVEDYHDREGDPMGVRTATDELREGLDSLTEAARGVAQATL